MFRVAPVLLREAPAKLMVVQRSATTLVNHHDVYS